MSAILKKLELKTINQEIQSHTAWYGLVSGMVAEKMLRNRKIPYLYILRKGELVRENKTDYYVSYVASDLRVKHQPFVITVNKDGWCYLNGGCGGPYNSSQSIEDVLYLMMHCNKGEPTPLKPISLKE